MVRPVVEEVRLVAVVEEQVLFDVEVAADEQEPLAPSFDQISRSVPVGLPLILGAIGRRATDAAV